MARSGRQAARAQRARWSGPERMRGRGGPARRRPSPGRPDRAGSRLPSPATASEGRRRAGRRRSGDGPRHPRGLATRRRSSISQLNGSWPLAEQTVDEARGVVRPRRARDGQLCGERVGMPVVTPGQRLIDPADGREPTGRGRASTAPPWPTCPPRGTAPRVSRPRCSALVGAQPHVVARWDGRAETAIVGLEARCPGAYLTVVGSALRVRHVIHTREVGGLWP